MHACSHKEECAFALNEEDSLPIGSSKAEAGSGASPAQTLFVKKPNSSGPAQAVVQKSTVDLHDPWPCGTADSGVLASGVRNLQAEQSAAALARRELRLHFALQLRVFGRDRTSTRALPSGLGREAARLEPGLKSSAESCR